jgi:hypothetical protein
MACPAPYSGPCANDAACGAGKVCVKTQITSFPGFPPTVYSYCGETCSTANTCSGSAMQRTCTGNACGLHCDPFLAAFDPSQRCPVGMLCINNGCTWLN